MTKNNNLSTFKSFPPKADPPPAENLPSMIPCPHGGFCATMPTPVSHLATPIPGLEFLNIGAGTLGELVASLYNWGIGIVGIAALIGIIIGGGYYLTAGGNTTMTSQGKRWISNSLFGLGLALISYLLLNTINPALVNPNQARIPLITGQLNNNTNTTPPLPPGPQAPGGPCVGGSTDITKQCANGATCYTAAAPLCTLAGAGQTGTCSTDTCGPTALVKHGDDCFFGGNACANGGDVCRTAITNGCRDMTQQDTDNGITGLCLTQSCR